MLNYLAKVNSVKGKKKLLLKELGFKSIIQATEFYNDLNNKKYNNEQVFKIMKNQYNDVIENLQDQKKQMLHKKN